MKNMTLGKLRGLQQLANDKGILTIVAIDHRGSLARMIDPEHPDSVTYDRMVQYKLELCSALASQASAMLLDPVYGIAPALSRSTLPRSIGLLVGLEASSYGDANYRITELMPGWGVEKSKRVGASAVKLLLYYRPDLKELAARQLGLVERVARECIKYDIPFLVEPVSYPIPTRVTDPVVLADMKGKLVVETAGQVTALPIDILKAEFPGDLRYQKDAGKLLETCRELDRASTVPWVLLSGGVDFETFTRQVELACRGGASGFLAGRAIWQEAVRIPDEKERQRYLATTVSDRLKRLNEIAAKYGHPWHRKLGLKEQELVPVSPDWYKGY